MNVCFYQSERGHASTTGVLTRKFDAFFFFFCTTLALALRSRWMLGPSTNPGFHLIALTGHFDMLHM